MKKLSKMMLFGLLATMILGVVAYAASPAEIYSELTGVTTEEAAVKRSEGKSYGELAKEADVYDEFVLKMHEEKIALIEERVEEGTITREDADALITALKENAGTCDPSNPQHLGREYNLHGAGNGEGCGNPGNGQGQRRGRGKGHGRGHRGHGLGNK